MKKLIIAILIYLPFLLITQQENWFIYSGFVWYFKKFLHIVYLWWAWQSTMYLNILKQQYENIT